MRACWSVIGPPLVAAGAAAGAALEACGCCGGATEIIGRLTDAPEPCCGVAGWEAVGCGAPPAAPAGPPLVAICRIAASMSGVSPNASSCEPMAGMLKPNAMAYFPMNFDTRPPMPSAPPSSVWIGLWLVFWVDFP